jgi:p-aminobenzoyl-glutamate transporter AbgT
MFQLGIPLPGPMKLLRMMRAFRVFRLFKRIPSLRKIMESLANAVPGVVNAFVIQIIVMCIFAIIAVDRFRDYGEKGYIINEKDMRIDYKTARDLNYGLEYYDQFGKAYFTMFQVLTGESWSEAIARPLVNSNTATTSTGGAIFFVLFCVLNGVVLINVVVAVLLEKMVEPEADKGSAEVEAVEEQAKLVETHIEEYEAFTKRLRQKVAELAVVKSQVAALLAHEGIKVAHS